jgi:hypothetical protein
MLSGVGSALAAASASSGFPAFVLLLGALVVALGAFALWVELLLRAAAVYVAVLFLPLALATLVWPAISHACRRLVEILVALIVSKFVIVSILCLSLGALASGSGFPTVLAGAALLLLAAFTPVALLRLVPLAEFGAVEHLDSVRHRATGAVTGAPRAAMGAASLAAQLGAGSLESALVAAGPVGSSGSSGSGGGASAGGAPPGVWSWPGEPSAAAPLGAPSAVGGDAPAKGEAPAAAGGRWAGPLPVVDAPDGARARVSDVQGRASIEQDDMGPTIRFVPVDHERHRAAPGAGPEG